MYKKNHLLCAVLAAGFALLQGCGGGEKDTSGKTKLVFYHFESASPTKELYEEMVADFMKENPDIYVQNMAFPAIGGDYNSKLLTMVAADTAPDVFEVISFDIGEMVKRGVMLELDELIGKSEVIDLSDWYPEVIKAYRYDGEVYGRGSIYGLPKDWAGIMNMYYNKDLFDKAGIEYPDKSWSWDELLEAAKKLTVRNERGRAEYFGAYMVLDTIRMAALVFQNGGRMFSEDGRKCLMDSEEVIETYEFVIEEMTLKHKVSPNPNEQNQIGLELFMSGKVAMFFDGRYLASNIINRTRKLADPSKAIRFGLAPALHRKKRANIMSPCGFALSRGSKHPEEAFRFLEFITGPEGATRNAKLGWGIPAIKSVAESDAFLTNPDHPEGINKVCLDDVDYTVFYPVYKYMEYYRFTKLLKDELDLAVLGKKSVREALKKATAKINREIARAVAEEEKDK